MQILSIPLRLFNAFERLPPRQRKWERVLEAALSVPRYHSIQARIEWARQTARFRIDTGFADPAALAEFLTRPGEYRSRCKRNPAAAPLAAPWPGAGNALALCPWFPLETEVGILQRSGFDETAERKPELIAGSLEALQDLAEQILRRRRRIETMRWGVIVWSSPGRPALTAARRAYLWRAFGVPVHEQFRGFHGELLAEECEARDGWHLVEENAIWEAPADHRGLARVTSLQNLWHPVLRLETGYEGKLAAGPCRCGRTGVRLTELEAR